MAKPFSFEAWEPQLRYWIPLALKCQESSWVVGSMLLGLLEYFLVSPFKEPWCQEARMTPPRGGMSHTHDQGVRTKKPSVPK